MRPSGFANWITVGLVVLALEPTFGQRALQEANLGVQREIEGAVRPGPPPSLMKPGRPRFSFSINGQYTPEVELDQPGRVGVYRGGMALGMLLPLPREMSIGIGAEDEYSHYDFAKVDDPVLKDLFEEVHIARASLSYRWKVNEKWSVFGAADMTASREDGAVWKKSLTGGGIASARRQVTPSFAFSLGVFARDRLEENPLILVVPSIDWQITDRFGMRTAQGVTFDYKMGAEKQWLLDLTARYEGREFRLSREDRLSEGTVADRRIPVLLSLHYRPHPGLHVQVYGGAVVWQEFKLIDGDGGDVAVVKTDPACVMGASGTLRF